MPWLVQKSKELSGDKPISLEGILSVEDAVRASEVSRDGSILRRKVDGSISGLEALSALIGTFGSKAEVPIDFGIRDDAEVDKELALGANTVAIGRLWICALSNKDEEGIRHVLRSLLREFDTL